MKTTKRGKIKKQWDSKYTTGQGTTEKLTSSQGVPEAQWLENPTDVTGVVGSIPAYNSEIFLVVPPPVTKQQSHHSSTGTFNAIPSFM